MGSCRRSKVLPYIELKPASLRSFCLSALFLPWLQKEPLPLICASVLQIFEDISPVPPAQGCYFHSNPHRMRCVASLLSSLCPFLVFPWPVPRATSAGYRGLWNLTLHVLHRKPCLEFPGKNLGSTRTIRPRRVHPGARSRGGRWGTGQRKGPGILVSAWGPRAYSSYTRGINRSPSF